MKIATKREETDERIDQALGLLMRAEAPEGMEDRLQRRLAAHTVAPTRARWQPVLVAVMGAAVVAIAIALLHHRGASAVDIPIVANTKPTAPLPALAPAPHPPLVMRHVASAKPTPASAVDTASFPAPPAPLTDQEKMLVRLAKAQERAIEAPPQVARTKKADVPLTHEEQLLVAVSHIRQDAVLDALDPVRRAEADARAKREFNAFVHEKDGGS